jgi:hypothetical protein
MFVSCTFAQLWDLNSRAATANQIKADNVRKWRRLTKNSKKSKVVLKSIYLMDSTKNMFQIPSASDERLDPREDNSTLPLRKPVRFKATRMTGFTTKHGMMHIYAKTLGPRKFMVKGPIDTGTATS